MQAAIQELVNKRDLLMSERKRTIEQYNKDISELNTAIETLSGKRVWEVVAEEKYDDVNPNYIKGSYEEM